MADSAKAGAQLLAVRDLSLEIRSAKRAIPVVQSVSFDVRSGESLGIVGESGSGKTLTALSLLRMLPAGIASTGGAVTLEGTDLLSLPEHRLREYRGGRIGMIFQDPMSALNPMMTVGYQIAEAVRAHRHVSRGQARRRALEMLELVNIPAPARRFGSYPHQLSGGMRQRVMIALALSCDPQLLIADEPTTALDVTVQAQVLHELRQLRELSSLALVLITHNMGIVAEACDRVLVMYGGRVVEQGPVAQILGAAAHPYTISLLRSVPSLTTPRDQRLLAIKGSPYEFRNAPEGCVFAERCPLAIADCRTAVPPQVTRRSGHEAACIRTDESVTITAPREPVHSATFTSPGEDPSRPLLTVQDLTKTFRVQSGGGRSSLTAVDAVTLHLGRNETLGLVGESGCGKSTLARAIVRIVEPTSGQIIFDGEDVTRAHGQALRTFRRRIQMVFQDPYASLNPRMRVGDAIAEPMIYRLRKSPADAAERVAELLRLVGLPSAAARSMPYQLSGGQRQRVGIARALAVEPSVLVCDEPVSALDVSMQAQIVNLFRDLQLQLGLSYVFIGHDLAVVRHLADRIAVMYLGQIVELGQSQDVCARPLHPYTASLLASVPDPEPAEVSSRRGPPPVGEPASPIDPPSGCRFHPRCPIGPKFRPERSICREQAPALTETHPGRHSACHFAAELLSDSPVPSSAPSAVAADLLQEG